MLDEGDRRLLLFADERAKARYSPILEERGLEVLSVQTLARRRVEEGARRVREALDGENFAAVAITSAFAAFSLDPPGKFEGAVYVVGSATAEALPEPMRSKCFGIETGNADALSELIARDSPGQILFPCGDKASDSLVRKLGSKITPVVVYETGVNSDLERELTELRDGHELGLPKVLVFFSPSGVDFVVPLLEKLGYDFEEAKLVAIGPSTKSRLEKAGLKPWKTAAEPTPLGVARLFDGVAN